MHYALPGSALVHAAMLGAGLLLFAAPASDDAPAMQSVAVEIISVATVSANQTSIVESDAAETLVSAGAEALAPVPPETIEAMAPQPLEPPVKPDVIERVDLAVLSAVAPTSLAAEAVAPIQQALLEPSETSTRDMAPVPHILKRLRPSEPTPRPQQAKAPPPRATAPAGNGGSNQADAIAARPAAGQRGNAGTGDNAEIARYPSRIVAQLRRALRYPRGAGSASGEVHVQFTIAANGQPSGLRVVKSSGNAIIDRAGLDTVRRAAPFPPIPAGANRKNWSFTIPLAFVRR